MTGKLKNGLIRKLCEMPGRVSPVPGREAGTAVAELPACVASRFHAAPPGCAPGSSLHGRASALLPTAQAG